MARDEFYSIYMIDRSRVHVLQIHIIFHAKTNTENFSTSAPRHVLNKRKLPRSYVGIWSKKKKKARAGRPLKKQVKLYNIGIKLSFNGYVQSLPMKLVNRSLTNKRMLWILNSLLFLYSTLAEYTKTICIWYCFTYEAENFFLSK